ncbi:hypothetical protein LTEGF4_26020 (plasmid) [Limnohabitans sp. TEGF004]|nr:hypothetical protein LTEGF4_26020 [Limnohabitans sp. TEGF004]
MVDFICGCLGSAFVCSAGPPKTFFYFFKLTKAQDVSKTLLIEGAQHNRTNGGSCGVNNVSGDGVHSVRQSKHSEYDGDG